MQTWMAATACVSLAGMGIAAWTATSSRTEKPVLQAPGSLGGPHGPAGGLARRVPPPTAERCTSREEGARPLSQGPLSLAGTFCIHVDYSSPNTPLQPSPDERAFFVVQSFRGPWVATATDTPAVHDLDADVPPGILRGQTQPFAWSGDSGALFATRRDKKLGWNAGPLRAVRIPLRGADQLLPPLLSSAGPLDELYWAGTAGKALAAFGTKGEYFRPAHGDPHPTVALVDASSGQVLQQAELRTMAGVSPPAMINGVSTVIDGAGRVAALIAIPPKRWVAWTEGAQPRVVPIGLDPINVPFVLSPDGRQVLVMRNLSASEVICELNDPCPAPTPRSGAIAELRDVASGRVIWALQGTASSIVGASLPAVSSDGRYALIPMPFEGTRTTSVLVSMETGAVLQRLPGPNREGHTLGFSPGGRTAWISSEQTLAVYKLGRVDPMPGRSVR